MSQLSGDMFHVHLKLGGSLLGQNDCHSTVNLMAYSKNDVTDKAALSAEEVDCPLVA